MFFTSSIRDDRVHPAHARKMVARMKEQGHEVLYWESTDGGHGGTVNSEQQAQLGAMIYGFLWDRLKMSARTAHAALRQIFPPSTTT